MRRTGFAACLLAAVCGGCTARAVSPQPGMQTNILYSTEVLSAAHKPPGYYPGYADLGLINTVDYQAWVAQNQSRIDDMQNRISAIREGRSSPSCIGEDRYTCVATLAQKFAIADYSHDRSVVAETKHDVNGKAVTPSRLELLGYVPRPDADKKNPSAIPIATHFVLKIGGSGKVAALDVKFADDPTTARTQEEYDATDAYEAVWAVAAKRCPTLSRIEVAKWIENTIKPNLKSYRKRVRSIVGELDVSKRMTFCGRTFQFNSVWALAHNRHGTDLAGGMILVME